MPEENMFAIKLFHVLRFSLETIGIGFFGITLSEAAAATDMLLKISIGLVTLFGVSIKVRREFKKPKE